MKTQKSLKEAVSVGIWSRVTSFLTTSLFSSAVWTTVRSSPGIAAPSAGKPQRVL